MNKAYKEYQDACNELQNTYILLGDALQELTRSLAEMGDIISGMNETAARIDWESVEEELKAGVNRTGDE